jgi:drug/metabolite transporter (DMT)-like permease
MFMGTEEDVLDVAPSPWRAHAIVMSVLGVAYVVFAIAVWDDRDNLGAALGRVVVALYGAALTLFALLTTALVALFRRQSSPILTSYAVALGLVGAIVIALLGRP